MDFSFLKTIIETKELQLFFAIIIIGILVYVVIALLKPFYMGIYNFFTHKHESKFRSFNEMGGKKRRKKTDNGLFSKNSRLFPCNYGIP